MDKFYAECPDCVENILASWDREANSLVATKLPSHFLRDLEETQKTAAKVARRAESILLHSHKH